MSENLSLEMDLDSSRKRLLKYTRRAFKSLPKLDKPRVLDVGCGSGVVTIELARLSNGVVTGIDIDQSILDVLNRKIERESLSNRVQTKKCSMVELDFSNESFDIIWAEGSLHAIGFERGLEKWRRLLKPNGFLVVHDEIRSVTDKLVKIHNLGYRLADHFLLPENAWWTEYYRPLENRIRELRERYRSAPEALRILGKVQNEIDMVKRSPKEYRSAFYIMQRK